MISQEQYEQIIASLTLISSDETFIISAFNYISTIASDIAFVDEYDDPVIAVYEEVAAAIAAKETMGITAIERFRAALQEHIENYW